MLNLVQVQEKLKDMPMQAVMQYANGMNPQVPPYVALGELNRRKQMQAEAEGMQAQAQAQGQQPTVKEQTEQSLGVMALQGAGQPAGQIGQTQEQEMPTQNMAVGGLTSLPMRSDMFNSNDYAGGGIVAFEKGGDTGFTEEEMRQGSEPTKEELAAFYERNKAPVEPTFNANVPTGPKTAKDLMSILVEQAAKGQTLEDIAADVKKAKELSGAKANPFEESTKRRAEYEQMMKQNQSNQGMEQLASWLTGAANAKPGQGVGMVLAGGGESQAKVAKAQQELNQKTSETMYNWVKADEKEQDAIARGDAKAILEAQQDKSKLNYNIAKLSYDKDSLAFTKFQSMLTQDPLIRGYVKQREDESIKPGSEKWRKFDELIENRTKQLAESAGFDYKMAPLKSVEPVAPKPKEKNLLEKAFGGDKKAEEKKVAPAKVDSGIPAGLPSGTKAIGRTPTGEVVYLTPDGKKVTAK